MPQDTFVITGVVPGKKGVSQKTGKPWQAYTVNGTHPDGSMFVADTYDSAWAHHIGEEITADVIKTEKGYNKLIDFKVAARMEVHPPNRTQDHNGQSGGLTEAKVLMELGAVKSRVEEILCILKAHFTPPVPL